MATMRAALRWRLAVPMAAAAAGGAVVMYPRRTAFAEAPDTLPSKKPIYDTYPSTPISKPPPSKPEASPVRTSPTPTDRLTVQIGKGRLYLSDQSEAAEQSFNEFMSWVLRHETSASNTIASLAPPKESGEQLLPGAIYVLVATMAGSIITRNRNILIRATFPLAVGITAGWYLIPITMQNVSELAWDYEKMVPAISETHAMIGGFTREAWKQTKVHGELVGQWADRTIGEARGSVEDWVKKGK